MLRGVLQCQQQGSLLHGAVSVHLYRQPFQAQCSAGAHLPLPLCPADFSTHHWEDPRVGNPLYHVTGYVRVAVRDPTMRGLRSTLGGRCLGGTFTHCSVCHSQHVLQIGRLIVIRGGMSVGNFTPIRWVRSKQEAPSAILQRQQISVRQKVPSLAVTAQSNLHS